MNVPVDVKPNIKSPDNLTNGIKTNQVTNDLNQNTVTTPITTTTSINSLQPKSKKARITEKITYEDLSDDVAAKKVLPQLNLTKIERYLHGPVPITNTETTEEPQNLELVQLQIFQDTDNWNTRTPHKVLVSATSAVNALGELSPGGALMRGFQEQSLARKNYRCFSSIMDY